MKCWQWDVCKEAYYGGCRTYCNCCLGSRACICTCCCPGVCPQGKRCQDYSGTLAMSVAVLVPAAPQVPGTECQRQQHLPRDAAEILLSHPQVICQDVRLTSDAKTAAIVIFC